ncbi:MAG TPA: methyltransferase domain-containing protein [Streptosporangiaceae bacterium]|nr:methyltransferase domain-containing protein [Streptosporangiaceae bacterium]
MSGVDGDYAFPHDRGDERRRLDMFAARLDPLTKRRIGGLGLAPDVHCLEIGGGRGSIASWLCQDVAPRGQVTATDLDTGFLSELSLPNLTVVRHDVRTDGFPSESFGLVHVRAVVMHIPDRMAVLRRMVSWLAPGGWLVVEEPDFGMWLGDFDPIWSAHAKAWHEAFPHGSMGQGRALLRQIQQLGLSDIGADAELDVVQSGTDLAEFYQLSMQTLAEPMVSGGVMTQREAARLAARPGEADFLGCGFAFIGAWGRRALGG